MKRNIFTVSNFSMMNFCRSKARRRFVAYLSLGGMLLAASFPVPGAPTAVFENDLGGAAFNYAKGASFTQADANNASFTANASAALIDWQSLNIGGGQTLGFTGKQFFNVVSGPDASKIAGTLNANGSVWVFNPAGISFIDGAKVNVGGVFAAVAANLDNKSEIEAAIDAELNGGEPFNVLPKFAAMDDGAVTVESDSLGVTIAGQGGDAAQGVALIGRSVSVSDGVSINADSATIAAGEHVEVDSVAGGKVSVKVSDFAASADDLYVDLGNGADASKPLHFGGDLLVATEGSVFVKGMVKADGDVTVEGLRDKAAPDVVVGVKQMSVASGKLLQGKSVSGKSAGKISVDGSLVATDGSVELDSDLFAALDGVVEASQNVTVTAGGYIGIAKTAKITSEAGDVTLDAVGNVNMGGTITADGDVTLAATGAGKSVKVGFDGTALADGSSVSGANVTLTGDKSAQVLAGTVTAKEAVTMSGKEYVAVNGAVKGRNVTLETTEAETLTAPVGGFSAGDDAGVLVTSAGSVSATEKFTATSAGVIVAQGEVKAETADLSAKNNGSIQLTSDNNEIGTVDVSGASQVSVKGAAAFGKVGADSDGNVTIHGNGADVVITKNVDIGGNFEVVNAANILLESGIIAKDVTFKGTKTAVAGDIKGEDLTVKSADGAANAALEQTAGDVDVTSVTAASIKQTGGSMKASDSIIVDDGIEQNGPDGTVISATTITAAKIDQFGGKISASEKITANVTQNGCEIDTPVLDGDLTQNAASDIATVGKVTGNVTQSAGVIQSKAAYDGGNLTIEGKLSQSDGEIKDVATLTLKGGAEQTGGKITATTLAVADEANDYTLTSAENDFDTVKGTAKNLTVKDVDDLSLGATTATKGNVDVTAGDAITVAGTVSATKDADGTGNVTLTTTAGDVNVNAEVKAAETAKIEATGGNVRVKGDVSGENVDINAGGFVQVNGGKTVSATAAATIDAGGSVTVLGAVEGKTVGLTAGKTDASKSVKVQGASASVSGTDAVTMAGGKSVQVLAGAKVESDGTVAATADEYIAVNGTVSGKTGVTLGTTAKDTLTSAVGAFPAGAPAGVIVQEGAVESAEGAVAVTSKGSVMVDGTSTISGKSVALTANGTDDGQGIQIAGGVTATGGDAEVTAGGAIAIDTGGTVSATKGADGTGNVTLTAGTGKTIAVNGSVTAAATATFNSNADVNASGSVTAVTVDAAGKTLTVKAKDGEKTAGSVTADTITADTLSTAGTVKADTIDADVAQTGGTINRRGADTALTFKKAVDQQGGTIGDSATPYAVTMNGALTQSGGTIAATTLTLGEASTVAGAVNAATIANGGLLTQNGGAIAANNVNGAFKQTAGTINKQSGDTLTFKSTVEQAQAEGKTAQIGSGDENVTVYKRMTQGAGQIEASTLTLFDNAEQTTDGGIVNVDALALAKSDSEVTLDKGANEIGSVYGRVGNLALKDTDGGLVIGNSMNNLEAGENVSIETLGDLTEFGGDYGKIVARNGKTTVTSTDGNINLDHAWNMFSKVEATAEKGSVNIVNATGYDPANPSAVQPLTVDGATAGHDIRIISKDALTIAGAVDASGGNIRLESTKGVLGIDAVVSGNNVTLAAANGITENAAVNAAADKYVHATGGDINVKANGTVDGNVAYVAVAEGAGAKVTTTGDGVKIASTGSDKLVYISDSTGSTAVQGGSATSKDGVTTFTDASVVAIDTANKVVVNNTDKAVTVGTLGGSGATVTEVLADPAGGTANNGTEAVAIGGGAATAASGIKAKDVSITVTGDPGTTAVTVDTVITATEGIAITAEKGDVNINAAVTAATTAKIEATDGKMRVKGDVTGADVDLDAGDFINIASGKTVEATTGDVTADSVSGNVDIIGTVVADNGMVSAKATGTGKSVRVAGGSVSGKAGVILEGGKSVQIGGEVASSDGDVTMTAKEFVAVDGGSVTAAKGTAKLRTNDAELLTAGGPAATYSEGQIAGVMIGGTGAGNIEAKDVIVESAGSVLVNAGSSVTATAVDSTGGTVSMTANGETEAVVATEGVTKQGVYVFGTVTAGDNLDITAKGNGGIQATGTLVADNGAATLTANNGAIDAQNAGNDFRSVTATAGGNITLNDKNDIILTEAAATAGDVRVRAMTDNLTVADGTVDTVTGQDIRLEATEGAIEVGAGVSGKNVTLAAKKGIAENAAVNATADKYVYSGEGDLTVNKGGNVGGNVAYVADAGKVTTAAGQTISAVGFAFVKANGDSFYQTDAANTINKVGDTVVLTEGGSAAFSAGTVEISGATKVAVNTDKAVVVSNTDKSLEVGTLSAAGDEGLKITEVLSDPQGGANADGTDMVELAGTGTGNASASGIVAKSVEISVMGETGGNVTVANAVNATDGDVKIGGIKGNVNVNSDVTATKDVTFNATGDVIVDGALVKAGEFTVDADGNVDDTAESYMVGNLTITASKGVTIQNAAQAGASGTVDIDSGAEGVTVDGSQLAANGAMTIDAEAGAVTVKGGSFVGGNSTVAVGMNKTGDAGTANLTVGAASDTSASQFVAKDDLTVKTTGVVMAQKNAKVASDTTTKFEGASVTVQSGAKVLAGADIDIDATGAVTVDAATVAAKGDVLVGETGDATKRSGSFTAQNGAAVTADGNVSAYVNGDAKVDNAMVKAGKFTVDANGTVTAETVGNLTIDASGAVVAQNEAQAGASGTVDIDATDAVTVDNATVAAKGKVLVGDATTPSGSFTAKGDATVTGLDGVDINVSGQSDVNGATVMAGVVNPDGSVGAGSSAGLSMTAGKNVKIEGGASVAASGTTIVTAKGDDGSTDKNGVVVTGTDTKLVADKGLTVQATTGDGNVVIKDGAYVAARNSVDGNTTAIISENGSVAVSGAATAVEAGKSLALTGAEGVTVDAATVAATGSATVTAQGNDGAAPDAKAVEITGTATVEAGTSVDITSTGAGAIIINMTSGVRANDGHVVVNNLNGKVDIKNATVKAKGGNGNVLIAAKGEDGNIKIDEGTKLTADKNLAIEATKGVEIVTTKTVEATDGDAVVIAQDGLVDMKTGTAIEATKGNVVIDGKGGVNLATVTASKENGTVYVKSAEKDITDANNNGEVNVTARNVAFDAANGTVGVDANHVETSVDFVAATSKGGVFLTETDGVTIGEVAKIDASKVTVDGATEVRSSHVVSGLSSTDSGAVVLEATEGDVTVSQAVDAKGANGNVLIAADAEDGSVMLDATVAAEQNVTVAAGKDVNVNANITAMDGDAYVEARGRDVTMASGTTVKAAGHNIRVAAKNDVKLSQVEAENVSVKAETGSITDNLDAETANVTATRLRLEAGGDVGKAGASGDNLNTDVAKIEVKAGDDAIISEKNAVTVGGVDGATIKIVDGQGVASVSQIDAGVTGIDAGKSATLVADGEVIVAEEVKAGANLLVNATSGGIEQNADITVGQNISVVADAGNIDQNANITATAGTIDVEATGGAIVMAADTMANTGANGNIRYRSGAGLAISKIDAGSGSVTLDALDDLSTATPDSKVTADSLAVAAKKVGESGGAVKFNVSKLSVRSATDVYMENARSVTVTEAKGDDFKVNRVMPDGTLDTAKSADIKGVVAENGSLDLDVTNGGLEIASGSSMSSTATTDIDVRDNVSVNGTVSGIQTSITAGGAVNINGKVSGNADIMAGTDVAFGTDGQVAGGSVAISAGGNITQNDATISASGGYVTQEKTIHAAIDASDVTLEAGGSIGTANANSSSYIGVIGTVTAKADDGDVAVAGADGSDLTVKEITAGRNASVYTTGTIHPNGTIKAGREVIVSARNYTGGPVRINTGNSLTVNNFRSGGLNSPLLALFNTVGGNSEPKTSSQHNKSIVFVDGRLAGGDIQTINTLGAIEAFPVQTPELKSEQGVFGNPTFLHDELDVANPLAVGAIDFLLQEIPILTLSSDFPIEVEKQVAATGLSPTTSYRFGQNTASEDDDAEEEKEQDGTGTDAEKSSGGEEASVKTAMK